MITTNLLSGERVTLRAMEPEDLEVLYSLENDTGIWDISSVNVPYSRYILKQFIAKGSHDIYSDGQLRLMVESVEEGTVIGMADLVDFCPRHLRAEIGIVLAHDYRNKNYGSEVLALMEKYTHEFLHLHTLYSYISIDNIPSLKLFEKAGYENTCTLKDWLYVGNTFIDAKIFQKILVK